MRIKELAEQYNEYMVERRRFYHSCPEPSLHEENTTKSIIADLEAMGLEITTFPDMYGCVATLRGGKPGGTVLLRADIDGLSVKEATGLPFASKNEGFMHACGHDNHIAMQLGAAKILCDMKDELPGTVKFLFQPAEEVAKGAQYLVSQGVMDDVDTVFGMHIWSTLDAPTINLQYGERMASCDQFTLTVKGTSAHGSAPHHGKDAVVASSAIIMAAQSICSRINDPLNALVVTIGTIKGGQRFNIIANHVEMEGTIRTFNREFRMNAEQILRDMAEATARAYGCTVELDYQYMTGPVINDNQKVVRIARNAATKLYGEDILVDFEKMTGSEDFAFYMEKAPGIFGFLGARNEAVEGSAFSNHHEKFTADEDALRHGAAVYAQFAWDFLHAED